MKISYKWLLEVVLLLCCISINTQANNIYLTETDKSKSSIIHISASDFNKETEKGIVLIDFWAPWCAPCRHMNPIIEDLAGEYKNSAKFVKMNVDNNKNFVSKQAIKSIPTILIYKNGKEVERIIGQVSKQQLKQLLDKHQAK